MRVIASDIAVHREEAAPGAIYVDTDRPDELAATIAQVWAERERPTPVFAASFERRRQVFVRAY